MILKLENWKDLVCVQLWSEDQPHTTCGRTCTALRLCVQRNMPARMHRATQDLALAQGSPNTCPAPSLITHYITQRWLWPTRAYIRVNLLHLKVHITFHNTSYTLFLSSITDLSVRVLTCLQALFVPPRRLIAAVPEVVTITLEHSLSPLPLNRSHRTYHF